MNLLPMVPHPNDGTSYFRAMGPLLSLEKAHSSWIKLLPTSDQGEYYDWHNMRKADIFFAQRPCLPVHLRAIQSAKEQRVPVWIDMDDNTFEIPIDSPHYETYAPNHVRVSMMQCLALADVVTVTTPELQTVVSQYASDVRVIPNAYDDCLLGTDPERLGAREKIIVWRGHVSHVRDLLEVRQAILEVAHAMPDWKWAFMGYNPFFITEHLRRDQFKVFPFVPISQYMHTLSKLGHAIQIVPLHESRFNRCKSNISWIEGSYAGARTLAPDWPEWQRLGVTNYHDPELFKETLMKLMSSPVTLLREDMGWEYIQKNLMLSRVNEERFKVLTDLTMNQK